MPKRGFKFRYLLAGLLLAAVIGAVAFNLWTRSAIERIREEHRADGYPVTVEELAEYFAPTDEQLAAAAEYDLAFELMVDSDANHDLLPFVGNADFPPAGEPVAEDMLREIAVYLDANEHALRHLHAAAEMETAQFPVEFFEIVSGNPPVWNMDRFPLCRNAARTLVLKSFYEAKRGNSEGAIEALHDTFAIGAALSAVPDTISPLVGNAIRTMAVTVLKALLERHDFSDAQLNHIQQILADTENDIDYQRGFITDFVYMDVAFQQLRSLEMSIDHFTGADGGIRYWTGRVLGFTQLEHLRVLRLQRDQIAIADHAIEERWSTLDAWPEFDNRLVENFMPILAMQFSPYAILGEVPARELGQLRTAHTAIAIERFRRANQHWPETLDELIPGFLEVLPIDPYTGDSLKYRVDPKGIVIYIDAPDGEPRYGYDFETGERNHHQTPFVLFTRDDVGSGSDGESALP